MITFTSLPFCRPGGAVCERCRARSEAGDRFREEAGRKYSLPTLPAKDFECPKGIAWDWKPGPRPRPRNGVSLTIVVPPDVAAARLKHCASCGTNVEGICTKQKATCGGKKPASIAAGVWMPRAHCPLGHWGVYVPPVPAAK